MNGILKLTIGVVAAVVAVPSIAQDSATQTPLTPSGPKVVYVAGTTTTEPPHVWVVNGTSSVDALLIQQALVSLGYKVTIDGVYGDKTEEVVRAFQMDHHLWVDGVVGPVTAKALGLDDVLGHTDDPPYAPPSTWVGP